MNGSPHSISPPQGIPAGGIDFEHELNPEQLAAVKAGDGPALVLAGAGSGKTRTLTYRVAWLLERGHRAGDILLLTFTNKAAREMLHRVEELTGVPAHAFWGGTFHSIGQRILRWQGASLGIDPHFTILDQGDAEALLSEVIREADSGFLKNKDHPKARVVAEIFSYTRNTCRNLEDVISERYPWLEHLQEKLCSFYRLYEARKRKQQVCDYDDLLELWLKLLKTNAEVRQYLQNRFRYLLVDEYQDTNLLQSSIINLMAEKHRNLMIVGDNWQCIYTWRGAEFANMDTFSETFPERSIYKIETNYRSSPEILRFANEMMLNHPPVDGYPLELRAHKPTHQRPYFVPVSDTRQQAWFVIRRIQGLREEGYNLQDIAVLYRAHYQAMDLQMELSRGGLPYTITSGVRFFEQAHIRDFVAQLRIVANPRDSAAFKRVAMLLPRIGTRSADRLFLLVNKIAERDRCSPIQAMSHKEVLAKIPKDACDDWTDLALTLQNIEDAMGGPALQIEEQDDLFEQAKAEEKQQRTAQTPSEIVRIGIDGWYGDFMRNCYENWTSRRDDLDSLVGFASRFETMSELLSQLVLLNSETSDRAIDPDAETLRLTTIHQAKGLEFPIVFVLGLSDGLFPLKRAIESGDVEEERRLFYVAVTRAMQELYLCHPRVSMTGGPPQLMTPCRFIQEVDPEAYDVLG